MQNKKLFWAYPCVILIISFVMWLILFASPTLPIELEFYSPFIHKILEGSVTLIFILIFIRAVALHLKTGDKRMAIISAAFFTGILLNLFHILTSSNYPFDLLTVKNIQLKPVLFYLFIEKLILASCFMLSVFYSAKKYSIKSNFIKKPFLAYLGIIISAIIFYQIIFPLFLIPYQKLIFLLIDNFQKFSK